MIMRPLLSVGTLPTLVVWVSIAGYCSFDLRTSPAWSQRLQRPRPGSDRVRWPP